MLLPECLDDFVGEDNPVRVVDAFIELNSNERESELLEDFLRSTNCGCRKSTPGITPTIASQAYSSAPNAASVAKPLPHSASRDGTPLRNSPRRAYRPQGR